MGDSLEWIGDRINEIKTYTDELSKITDTYYLVKEWTLLKLIFISSFVDLYTKIIPNHVENWFYIDLFAGCGVNQVISTSDLVLGSSLIAPCFARKPFTKMFLVDDDKEQTEALSKRITYLSRKDNFKNLNPVIYTEDCNKIISSIVEDINEYKSTYHYLACIDPYGMEIDWGTMEVLLELDYGDIMFTYQTQEIARTWGKAKSNQKSAETMTKFFGNDDWKYAKGRDDLLKLYENNLRIYRSNIIDVLIQGKNFKYHLIFATRETKGGTPWLQAVTYIKDKIEEFGGERLIRTILGYLSGKNPRLSDY